MLTLAVTASRFNKRPSKLVGLLDPSVALAFDVECAEVLFENEIERENKRFEALAGVPAVGMLGGKKSEERNLERW